MKKNIIFEVKLYRTILSFFTDFLYMKNTRSSKIISPIMISNFNTKDLYFSYNESIIITTDFHYLTDSEINIIQEIHSILNKHNYKELYNT
jgi:hypothetical protein